MFGFQFPPLSHCLKQYKFDFLTSAFLINVYQALLIGWKKVNQQFRNNTEIHIHEIQLLKCFIEIYM